MCCCSKDALKGEWRRANSHTGDCNVLASLTLSAVCLAVLEPGTLYYGVMESYGTMDWTRTTDRNYSNSEWMSGSYGQRYSRHVKKTQGRIKFSYLFVDWAWGRLFWIIFAFISLTWILALIWKSVAFFEGSSWDGDFALHTDSDW